MGWADKIMGVVGHAKDAGSSLAVERWLAREIEEFGELKNFRLNSRDRSIRTEVLPRGEQQSILVEIDSYELIESGGKDYVVIKSARASREWLSALLNRFVIGKRFQLPAQYSRIIRTVLQG